jgi:hypothetical protein
MNCCEYDLLYIALWKASTCNICMFVIVGCECKCINVCSRNNQRYAQICTTALFYMLAPTCFGSSLPSSGSFWIRLSYMKIQIDLVVNHIMWNTPILNIFSTAPQLSISQKTLGTLPEHGNVMPKHVGATTHN